MRNGRPQLADGRSLTETSRAATKTKEEEDEEKEEEEEEDDDDDDDEKEEEEGPSTRVLCTRCDRVVTESIQSTFSLSLSLSVSLSIYLRSSILSLSLSLCLGFDLEAFGQVGTRLLRQRNHRSPKKNNC